MFTITGEQPIMKFGNKVRATRLQRGMTQQELAKRMSVSVSYISKVENERLHFGDYPSEKFILRLASELHTDEDVLLMLADKVPTDIREKIRQRPNLFRAIAQLDDRALDSLTTQLVATPSDAGKSLSQKTKSHQ